MGQARRFRCPKCDYSAVVSGGEDRGINLFVQTVQCVDCRELMDVPIRKFEMPKSKDRLFPDPKAKPLIASWIKFRVGEATRLGAKAPPSQYPHLAHYWQTIPLRCKNIPSHRVQAWYGMHLPLEEEEEGVVAQASMASKHAQSGRCPKCGQKMVRSHPISSWE